ncbi:unnamed protein product [Mucor hiemalis]
MIPSTFRNSLSLVNILKASVPKQHGSISKCFYTVDSNSNDTDEEVKEEQKKNFWEIPARSENDIETNRSVKSRVSKTAAETRDFKELLDTLFERKLTQPAPAPTKPRNKDTDSVIEKKLLDLVMRNRQLYKEKAPLPRSMMGPIYGKTTNKVKKDKSSEEEDDDDSLDFLHPDTNSTNWKMKDISQNERIILKDLELQSINAIVETSTSIDLLNVIMKEINQDKYPKYYPRVLAKAIEHASRKDPYLALTIFELAKYKSLNSYILGCTTKVYDAMLLLKWEAWRDVYGMLNLIEEMTVNGITYSNDSRRIVRSVVQEIEAEGGALEEEDTESSVEQLQSKGIYWNADEKRACNVMKEMVGKWIIKN